MQKKMLTGVLIGFAAGLTDMIPMIIMDLPWNAYLSAMSMWIVTGFLISVTALRISSTLKGLLMSFLVLYPNIFIIGFDDPVTLVPVVIMTAILGSLCGFVHGKLNREM